MKEMPRPKLMVGGFVDFDFCSGDQDKKEGDRSNSSRGAVSMRRFYHPVGQGKKRKPRRFRRGSGIGAFHAVTGEGGPIRHMSGFPGDLNGSTQHHLEV